MYYENILFKENHRFSIVQIAAAYPKAFKNKIDARELDAINVPDLCEEILQNFIDNNTKTKYSFNQLSDLFYGTLCIYRHKVDGLFWIVKDHKDFFQNIKNRIFVQIKTNIFKQVHKTLDDNDIMQSNTFEELMNFCVLPKSNDAISIRDFNLRETNYFKEHLLDDEFDEMSQNDKIQFFDLIEGRININDLLADTSLSVKNRRRNTEKKSLISSNEDTFSSQKIKKNANINQRTDLHLLSQPGQDSFLDEITNSPEMTIFNDIFSQNYPLEIQDENNNNEIITQEILLDKICKNKAIKTRKVKLLDNLIEINNRKFQRQMFEYDDTMRCTTTFTDFKLNKIQFMKEEFSLTLPCHKFISITLKKFIYGKFSNIKKPTNQRNKSIRKRTLIVSQSDCNVVSYKRRLIESYSNEIICDNNSNNVEFNWSVEINNIPEAYKKLCDPENLLIKIKNSWIKNDSPITMKTLTLNVKNRTAAALIFYSLLVLKKNEIIGIVKEDKLLTIKYIQKGRKFV